MSSKTFPFSQFMMDGSTNEGAFLDEANTLLEGQGQKNTSKRRGWESVDDASSVMTSTSMSSTSREKRDTTCKKCKDPEKPGRTLFRCGKCKYRFHSYCHKPPPGTDFICASCVKRLEAGTQSTSARLPTTKPPDNNVPPKGLIPENPRKIFNDTGSSCERCGKPHYSFVAGVRRLCVPCKMIERSATQKQMPVVTSPKREKRPFDKTKLHRPNPEGKQLLKEAKEREAKKRSLNMTESDALAQASPKSISNYSGAPSPSLVTRNQMDSRAPDSSIAKPLDTLAQRNSSTGRTGVFSTVGELVSATRGANLPSEAQSSQQWTYRSPYPKFVIPSLRRKALVDGTLSAGQQSNQSVQPDQPVIVERRESRELLSAKRPDSLTRQPPDHDYPLPSTNMHEHVRPDEPVIDEQIDAIRALRNVKRSDCLIGSSLVHDYQLPGPYMHNKSVNNPWLDGKPPDEKGVKQNLSRHDQAIDRLKDVRTPVQESEISQRHSPEAEDIDEELDSLSILDIIDDVGNYEHDEETEPPTVSEPDDDSVHTPQPCHVRPEAEESEDERMEDEQLENEKFDHEYPDEEQSEIKDTDDETYTSSRINHLQNAIRDNWPLTETRPNRNAHSPKPIQTLSENEASDSEEMAEEQIEDEELGFGEPDNVQPEYEELDHDMLGEEQEMPDEEQEMPAEEQPEDEISINERTDQEQVEYEISINPKTDEERADSDKSDEDIFLDSASQFNPSRTMSDAGSDLEEPLSFIGAPLSAPPVPKTPSKPYDSSILDSYLYPSPANPPPFAPVLTWGAIDPRVVWPKRISRQDYEAKQAEIRARPSRKANFGKVAPSAQIKKWGRQLRGEYTDDDEEEDDKKAGAEETKAEREKRDIIRQWEEITGIKGIDKLIPRVIDGKLCMVAPPPRRRVEREGSSV